VVACHHFQAVLLAICPFLKVAAFLSQAASQPQHLAAVCHLRLHHQETKSCFRFTFINRSLFAELSGFLFPSLRALQPQQATA
jgi:hypothetical protein